MLHRQPPSTSREGLAGTVENKLYTSSIKPHMQQPGKSSPCGAHGGICERCIRTSLMRLEGTEIPSVAGGAWRRKPDDNAWRILTWATSSAIRSDLDSSAAEAAFHQPAWTISGESPCASIRKPGDGHRAPSWDARCVRRRA